LIRLPLLFLLILTLSSCLRIFSEVNILNIDSLRTKIDDVPMVFPLVDFLPAEVVKVCQFWPYFRLEDAEDVVQDGSSFSSKDFPIKEHLWYLAYLNKSGGIVGVDIFVRYDITSKVWFYKWKNFDAALTVGSNCDDIDILSLRVEPYRFGAVLGIEKIK